MSRRRASGIPGEYASGLGRASKQPGLQGGYPRRLSGAGSSLSAHPTLFIVPIDSPEGAVNGDFELRLLVKPVINRGGDNADMACGGLDGPSFGEGDGG